MANIYDVAKKAGVSKSTVSLVLNNSQSVKPETRKIVEEAMKSLNYVPNNNARCLGNRTMNSLAIVILTEGEMVRDYSFHGAAMLGSHNICDGIHEGLSDTDYSLATEYFDVRRTGSALPKLIENRRVDGVFVVGSFYDGKMIKRIEETGIPTVAVGIGINPGSRFAVVADPCAGFKMGVEKLIRMGHKKICCLNSPHWFLSSVERARGALQAAQENAYDLPQDAILYTQQNNGASAYETFRAYWEEGNRPDAVMAANSTIALGAMRCLYDVGAQVPRDLSMLVYDDSQLCGYSTPALSAINTRNEKMGKQAANMMLNRIADSSMQPQVLCIESHYVKRDSVLER